MSSKKKDSKRIFARRYLGRKLRKHLFQCTSMSELDKCLTIQTENYCCFYCYLLFELCWTSYFLHFLVAWVYMTITSEFLMNFCSLMACSYLILVLYWLNIKNNLLRDYDEKSFYFNNFPVWGYKQFKSIGIHKFLY